MQISTLWDPSHTTCDEDIRTHLVALPEALDDTYIRCLRRIEETNDKRSSAIAPRAFKWVAFAQRPLTDRELRELANAEPEDMPIKQSMVLNTSVVDYCANLLVLNPLTGVVEFTHSTVKQLLLETHRLPVELQRYALSAIQDDLWCGSICLAYAQHHHKRNAVVSYTTQPVDTSFNSALLNSTLGKLASLGKFRSSRTPAPSFVSIPLPAVRRNLSLDAAMHRYMCEHWLSHNKGIQTSDRHYSLFEDLCLSSDNELQSWTTNTTSAFSRYQGMMVHGVVNNHLSLLRVAVESLQRREGKERQLLQEILESCCPGTESGLLHLAAVLDHAAVIKCLVEACPSARLRADLDGKSALQLAAESHCNMAFLVLYDSLPPISCPVVETRPLRGLFDEASRVKTNILSVCATVGNIEAMQYVAGKTRAERHPEITAWFLCDAFYLACSNGKHETAEILVSEGVDPSYVYANSVATCDHLEVPTKEISTMKFSLTLALELQDSICFSTLLSVGASVEIGQDRCDFRNIVDSLGRRTQLAKPFIDALIAHLSTSGGKEVSDRLEELIFHLFHSSDLSLLHKNIYLETFIESWQKTTGRFASTYKSWFSAGIKRFFASLVEQASDKFLVIFLRQLCHDRDSFIIPSHMALLARRQSSRALETLFEEYRSKLRTQESDHIDLLEVFVKVWGPLHHVTASKGLSRSDNVHQHYELVLKEMIAMAFEAQSYQNVEFLVCQSDTCWHVLVEKLQCPETELLSISSQGFNQNCQKVFDTLHSMKPVPAGERLAWLRILLRKPPGYPAREGWAKSEVNKLIEAHSDGNFALNFPAGYVETEHYMPIGKLINHTCIGPLQPRILLTVYGWNFRLNRSRHRSMSEADILYVALLMTTYLDEAYLLQPLQHLRKATPDADQTVSRVAPRPPRTRRKLGDYSLIHPAYALRLSQRIVSSAENDRNG